MSDAVSREAALAAIRESQKNWWGGEYAGLGMAADIIEELPPLSPAPEGRGGPTQGAYIEGDTVHIVIDFGELAIHREGVAALDEAIKGGSPALGVETLGSWHPLVHLCEACSTPAISFVRLYPEGEKVWFCDTCRES